MISSDDITTMAYDVASRYEEINTKYIQLMAKHIRDIGKLSATDLHRLNQMVRMNQNVDEINKLLIQATGLSKRDIDKVYKKSGLDIYQDAKPLYNYKHIPQLPFAENAIIQQYLNAMAKRTQGTFINLANTTVIQQDYIDAVDKAIQAVSSGLETYDEAIRGIIKDKSRQGVRVQYASGITRRLDSAVTMNVLEGVQQVSQWMHNQVGEEFGADGVEISAHALCAPDHIGIQGMQYSLKEFEALDAGLDRPIGTLNCRHQTFPIVLGVSHPTYTKQQLQELRDNAEKKIKIGDGQYTKYECSQLLRKLETKMRYTKDEIIGLKAAGYECTEEMTKLNALRAKYRDIASRAGLALRYERAYVPGFKK